MGWEACAKPLYSGQTLRSGAGSAGLLGSCKFGILVFYINLNNLSTWAEYFTLKKTSLPEQVLQVLDVLDGQPERLNLGESFARRLEEGESLPQLRGTVHQLNRQKARLSQG